DDVDAALADDAAQRAPDAGIERSALGHLDVLRPEHAGPFGDAERGVGRVADVAHGHGDAGVRTLCAEKDRLLGTPTGAPHRSELEDVNALCHRSAACEMVSAARR